MESIENAGARVMGKRKPCRKVQLSREYVGDQKLIRSQYAKDPSVGGCFSVCLRSKMY